MRKRNGKVLQRRYKMLPLDLYFLYDHYREEMNESDRIDPVFHRNGKFLDRQTKTTWVEVNGEAWLYSDYEFFLYELNHDESDDTIPVEEWRNILQSVWVLRRNKLLNKQVIDKVRRLQEIKELKELRVGAAKFNTQVLREIKEQNHD